MHRSTPSGRSQAGRRRVQTDLGPATLENYQFLEKISHFDRERSRSGRCTPRGFLAYGTFTATGKWGDEPIERYTRAKLFSTEGKQTDVALRFFIHRPRSRCTCW